MADGMACIPADGPHHPRMALHHCGASEHDGPEPNGGTQPIHLRVDAQMRQPPEVLR
jgi:hypothetical protein